MPRVFQLRHSQLVVQGGLEPPRLAAADPKSAATAVPPLDVGAPGRTRTANTRLLRARLCRLGYRSEMVGGETRTRTGTRPLGHGELATRCHAIRRPLRWWNRRDSDPHCTAPQAVDSAGWSTVPMVVGGGFGPPAFTARVTGLQPAAFSHFAYPTSCASALGSGGRIRTSDGFPRRINNPLDYH